MKRLMVEIIVVAACILTAFVTRLETGHRMGYDTAWTECKFDAKQRLYLIDSKEFWIGTAQKLQ